MLTDRRSVLRAIGLLAAAPLIVRAGSLMPVRVWEPADIIEGPAWFMDDSGVRHYGIARIWVNRLLEEMRKGTYIGSFELLTRPEQIPFDQIVTNHSGDYGFGRQRLQLIGETG